MAQATDGHHATLGELVSAQVSSEKFLVGTDSADTYFLVDHIHSAEAVEADLIETLFARLVDGVEAGARVLFFAAVWGRVGQTGGSRMRSGSPRTLRPCPDTHTNPAPGGWHRTAQLCTSHKVTVPTGTPADSYPTWTLEYHTSSQAASPPH